MTLFRTGNGLINELKETEQQLAEMKALQFNGSSNNYSGKVITSNTFSFTPSSDYMLAKGFIVVVKGADVSLVSLIMEVRRTNGTLYPFRKAFRFTSFDNGMYENRWNFIDWGMEYPSLSVKAHAIVNGKATISVEGWQRAF